MKKILIDKMSIANFKGISNLVINFNSRNINLVGVNGSGKTSVFDAFTWCLFGKDSKDRSDSNKDFGIKPKDPITQEEIHNLDITVELTLLVNGQVIMLKRVYSEIWTKKRGALGSEFSGHETTFYINGVEKLKKDYEKFIAEEIVSEVVFKLLTSVTAFTSLPWQKQRELLETLVNLTDEEIIKKYPQLKDLGGQLILGRTVEDVIKIAEQDKRSISKQLEIELPSKIAALSSIEYKNLDKDYNDDANSEKLNESYARLSNIESKIANETTESKAVEFESAKLKYENDILKLEMDIKVIESGEKKELSVKVQDEKNKLSGLKQRLDNLKSQEKNIQDRISNGERLIADKQLEDEKLRTEYKKIKAEEFVEQACSYCGQALPTNKVEEAREHFNLHKAERMETIKAKGISLVAEINKYKTGIEEIKKQLENVDETEKTLADEMEEQEIVIYKLENQTLEENPKITETKEKIESYHKAIKTLESQIAKEKTATTGSVYGQARAEILNEIEFLNERKAEYRLKLQNQEKISSLENEQKTLLKKQEECFKLITLGEKFRDIRANYISNEVNKHFKLVNFKLFEVLVNGGIENTCVATYRGVAYPSCSNGEKINIGLDIINGLQGIYGVSAPIFIDNAEAVTDWLVDTDCQLIKMIAKENIKQLEIVEEVK